MGGTSSTQGRTISECYSADDDAKMDEMLNHAYDHKGGNGIATVMGIANKSKKYKLQFSMYEGFSGRWEQDYPEVINPNEIRGMVHRKRDSAACGSVGYLAYKVMEGNKIVCRVFFAWSTPYSGHNRVGCGYLMPNQVMDRNAQQAAGELQYYKHEVFSKEFAFSVSIEVARNESSPSLKLIFKDEDFS